MGFFANSLASRMPNAPPDPMMDAAMQKAAAAGGATADQQQAILDQLHAPGSIFARFARAAKLANTFARTPTIATPPGAPDTIAAAANATSAAGIAAARIRRAAAGRTLFGPPALLPSSARAVLAPRTLLGS